MLTSLALAVGGLALAAGPATAEDPTTAPLITHSVTADLLGVLGTTLVTASAEGGTHVRAAGSDWTTTSLDRTTLPEDVTFLADGTLVAVTASGVQVLDVAAPGSVATYSAGPDLWTATPTTGVALTAWDLAGTPKAAAVDLATSASTDLLWPAGAQPPASADADLSGVGRGWVSSQAWIAPEVYVSAANRLLSTQLAVLYLDGITDGFSVTVNGAVLWAKGPVDVGGHPGLRYVSLENKTLRDCTAAPGATVPLSCRSIKTRVKGTPTVHAFGDVLGLNIAAKPYLWQSGKLLSASGLPKGTTGAFTADGVGTSPVLAARGRKPGFYTLDAKGKAKLFAPAVVEPVAVRDLALGAGWVVGTDNAGSARGWMRSLAGGTIGAEIVLSKKATQIATSGDRVVVNGRDGLWFYRGGVRTAKLASVPALGSLSGPYALVKARGGTWTMRTESRVVAKGIAAPFGQFGTLVAQVDETAHTVVVNDYASGVAVPRGPVQSYDPSLGRPVAGGVWGDWLMLGFEQTLVGSVHTTAVVWDYPRSRVLGTRAMSSPTLGDGVVAGLDSAGKGAVWMFAGGQDVTPVDTAVAGPVAAGNGLVAFADANGSLTVSSLGGAAGGGSSPRVLSLTTGTGDGSADFRTYDGWRKPWQVSAEATKAVGEGTLEIRRKGSGELVAERSTESTPSGGVTASWDGVDDSSPTGEAADTGDYVWTLDVWTPDGNSPLVALGGGALTGDIRVENSPMAYPLETVRITNTAPVVGQELTADIRPVSPDATFSYQWLRGSTKVGTGSTYTVTPPDLGKRLTLRVTASGVVYTEARRTSAATKPVGKGTMTPATVTLPAGAPVVNDVVTATVGPWVPATVTSSSTWYRMGARGVKPVKVGTGTTYKVTPSDIGHQLKFVVAAKAAGYKDGTASALTLPAVAA